MMVSHEYPPKNNFSSPRYILSPGHSKSNSRPSQKDFDSFQSSIMKSPYMLQNSRSQANNQSFISSAKGLSSLLKETRSPSHLRSLSPLRQESKILESLNNRGSYKPYLDRSLNPEQINAKKQDSPENMNKKVIARQTKVTNKQLNLSSLDEFRKKRLNMTQIKEFSERYKIRCTPGHGNKALEKCATLLATETDPYILENIFPGKYTSYTGMNMHSKDLSKSPKSSLANVLDVSVNHQSPLSYLPTIRSRKFKNNGDSPIDSRVYTDGPLADSHASIFDNNKLSALSSIFGKTKWKMLPQMEAESFRDSLSFYQDFMHRTVFLIIEAVAKEASLEVGFCELIWDDSKPGSGLHMPKFFVQRVLKKMGHLVPVTVSIIDYLFKTYNVEKISTDILPGNEVMSDALSLAGLKFEKVFYRNETKWQIFAVRKKDFYHWFKDALAGRDESPANASPVKVNGK